MGKHNNLRNESEANKRTVRLIMLASGLLFAVLGAFCAVSPASVVDLLDMDEDVARTLGFALIFVGLVESLVIPKILFGSVDRK